MYELIQLTENDYYFDCPAKIGLVRISESEVVLIDSGLDKGAAKKVLRVLDEKGWKLKAVYNTHSHADHIGGNRYLQEKSGCAIYAKGLERAYVGDTILEPIGLYGGLPIKDLKHKFTLADSSRVLPLTEEELPECMTMLDLKGHCTEMIGFITKDGTAYIADSVSSEETLAKYGIGYMWNPTAALETLGFLRTINAERFVPSHADVTKDIEPLVRINEQAIKGLREKLVELCRNGVTFETLLGDVFKEYNMTMTTQQYYLIGSTIRSYLSDMYEHGIVMFEIVRNQMVWKAK